MADERLCPVDSTQLRRLERSGVHVDACPSCRGIWLDRGELDKIVVAEAAAQDDFEREISGGDRERRPEDAGYGKPKKKRRSMLEDLLDLGGGGAD
jgi:Zn-finger nucleic acid-binding protein